MNKSPIIEHYTLVTLNQEKQNSCLGSPSTLGSQDTAEKKLKIPIIFLLHS